MIEVNIDHHQYIKTISYSNENYFFNYHRNDLDVPYGKGYSKKEISAYGFPKELASLDRKIKLAKLLAQ